MSPVGRVDIRGIELEFDVVGDPDGPVLLLVAGLGAQLVSWDDAFVDRFTSRGMRVVRFDNRDVGLSTHFDHVTDAGHRLAARFGGQEVEAPYLLGDMAADAVGLLDALDISAAHVLGASMGGMIAQTMAIEHASRLLSLTSVMSTTGDRDVGQADPSVLVEVLLAPMPEDPAEALAHKLRIARAIGSPDHFDEQRARRRAELETARSTDPQGTVRQLLAIVSSPSRTEALRSVRIPSLVVHGEIDPLVGVSGGMRTHECLEGSELLLVPDMGHDLPPPVWDLLAERVAAFAGREPTALR
jgi:pimeloyl-ACP methyl ester carboxylesterase